MSVTLLMAVICFAALAVWERVAPRQELPNSKGWWLRAGFLTLCQYFISISFSNVLTLFFNNNIYSTFINAAVAIPIYVVVTFAMYWWHRLRHASTFVWNTNHQIHHSPRRIEAITTFYMHPIEIVINGLITASITCALFRQSVEVNAWVSAYTALANLFFHTNVKTPQWLGYLIQRPEMHILHHEKDVHARNYSDLPIWDILFKTFENPETVNTECGFEEGEELQFMRMLSCKEVIKEVDVDTKNVHKLVS